MTRMHGIAATLGAMAVTLAAGPVNAGPPGESGHGFAPVNGTRLFYEVKGTGPAVVLIHGGQLDCRMWDGQFAAFSRDFRVIRYDVRGYGGSFQPDMLYSDAEDLAGLLDYLKVDKAHIVGLSLGGRIAIDFAVAHPARVASLTLAGPGLSGYEPPDGAETDLRMWNIIKAARDEGPDQATRAVAERPLHGPGHGAGPARARPSEDRPRERPLLAGEPPVAATPEGRPPPRGSARSRSRHSWCSETGMSRRSRRRSRPRERDRRIEESGRSRVPATWSTWRSPTTSTSPC